MCFITTMMLFLGTKYSHFCPTCSQWEAFPASDCIEHITILFPASGTPDTIGAPDHLARMHFYAWNITPCLSFLGKCHFLDHFYKAVLPKGFDIIFIPLMDLFGGPHFCTFSRAFYPISRMYNIIIQHYSSLIQLKEYMLIEGMKPFRMLVLCKTKPVSP